MDQFRIIDKNKGMCCVQTKTNIALKTLLWSLLGNQIL